MKDVRLYIVAFGCAWMAALFIVPLIWNAYKSFRRMGVVVLLIAAGFLHSMATKPVTPTILWDSYLVNNGSHFNTNTWASVTFAWAKTRVDLPNTEPLYISRRPKGSSSEYETIATTTVGGSPYTYTADGVTNYQYYVYHNWIPPAPVHTNGVWLGNVIEPAKGAQGVEKMVIIKSKLEVDGKVKAP